MSDELRVALVDRLQRAVAALATSVEDPARALALLVVLEADAEILKSLLRLEVELP